FSVSGLLNQNGESGAILSAPGTSQKRNSDSVTAKTGADGKAVVSLRSTAAGQGRVTATMVNGNTGSAKVVFVPDTATAHVSAVTLNGDTVSLMANGKNVFTYQVLVTDNNNNPVPGVTVTPSADREGVTVSAAAGGKTDANGRVTLTLGSTKVVSDITVSAQAGTTAAGRADRKVSFTADLDTAKIASLAVTTDGVVA